MLGGGSAKGEGGSKSRLPTAGGGWQESCLLGDPTGARSEGPVCCPGSGASSLITAAFVSAFLYPPRWMGPCCCQTGWTKSQTAKMTRLAAVSLIKADSFQRRTWETAIGQGKINWKLTSVVKTQSLPEKIKFFLVLLKYSDLRTP